MTLELMLSHRHEIECAITSAYSRIHGLTIRNQSKKSDPLIALAHQHQVRVHHEKPQKNKPSMEAYVLWDVFDDWKSFRQACLPQEVERVLFLDRLQDPQNVGNIVRTARFLGATAVVLPKSRSAKLGETVVRTSTGAALSIPILHPSNLVRAMIQFQEEGAYIWGLDAHAEDVIGDIADIDAKLGLVIGSEGEGMAKLTQKTCDRLVRLTREGFHESLNASSAAAMAMYAVRTS